MDGCLVAYQVVGGCLDLAGGPPPPLCAAARRSRSRLAAGDAGVRLLGQCIQLRLPEAPLLGVLLRRSHPSAGARLDDSPFHVEASLGYCWRGPRVALCDERLSLLP
jgi:hypothetical protein